MMLTLFFVIPAPWHMRWGERWHWILPWNGSTGSFWDDNLYDQWVFGSGVCVGSGCMCVRSRRKGVGVGKMKQPLRCRENPWQCWDSPIPLLAIFPSTRERGRKIMAIYPAQVWGVYVPMSEPVEEGQRWDGEYKCHTPRADGHDDDDSQRCG